MKKFLVVPALVLSLSAWPLRKAQNRKRGITPQHATLSRTVIGPGLAC